MGSSQMLAAINAALVSTSGLLILAGLLFIRQGQRQRHIGSMAAATVLLSIFLVLYLYRFISYGITPFPGPGWTQGVYYSVLISHVLLAVVSTPMVLLTLLAARGQRFEKHKGLGRITSPMWLYVAVTGPMVYFMLYHWY